LGLKKNSKKRGSKVNPIFKNGQKKCPKIRNPLFLGAKKPKKNENQTIMLLCTKKITQKML